MGGQAGSGPLRVAVIIGSTRKGRAGEAIAGWFVEQARRREDISLDVLDLLDYAFPDRFPDRATPQMRRFAGAVERAEAYVVVTPEYNRSFPASLKQAIDYAYDEWRAKPVGFVSYGSRSLGIHAVEALRCVFTELHTVTVRDGVALDLLDEGGLGTEPQQRAATAMLDELAWWGLALREARARRPYIA
ncbi:NADPH-dependent oxidoreductase [Streptomyces klenkii]|uniref:NADPH-dependent oxidoreductase n=1 Tax=Streptomyces klenkii TaxID=1420899 RepID=A0A3A9ZUI7_9ACTN|nr:NAD(P)H-dependent oxidoreductase [Streptomyces klenkii]RKN51624.1 NADPH-dependent oxidoreductase [Streptomyces klenkii]